MHRSCIRCLSTSARSLVSQASTSASSSILPEHLKSRPVVPELKHVEPQLRELLLNPLRHTAVYYGNNPGALPFSGPWPCSMSSIAEIQFNSIPNLLLVYCRRHIQRCKHIIHAITHKLCQSNSRSEPYSLFSLFHLFKRFLRPPTVNYNNRKDN